MKRAYITLGRGDVLDDAVMTALSWCLPLAGPDHPETVLWLPHRDNLEDLPVTRRLVSKGLTTVYDSPGRRGPKPTPQLGPVIAYMHVMDRLAMIEPARHPIVLIGACSAELDPILRDLPYHQPWIDAFDPEHLAGRRIAPRQPLGGDPIAREAMRTFTSTTRAGETMYRSDDGGRVAHGLMLLRRHGHRLDPHEWFAAALGAGWTGTASLSLRSVVNELAQGRRKRPKRQYAPSIYERWRQ